MGISVPKKEGWTAYGCPPFFLVMKGMINMIEAYSQNISVAANSAVPFNVVSLKTGCVVTQSDDKLTFYLNRAGIYKIEFNGYGSSTAAGTIGVQITVNGNNVTQAAASATTEAASPENISCTTLVAVDRVCACAGGKPVQVVYTGSAGAMTLANVIITKIK